MCMSQTNQKVCSIDIIVFFISAGANLVDTFLPISVNNIPYTCNYYKMLYAAL